VSVERIMANSAARIAAAELARRADQGHGRLPAERLERWLLDGGPAQLDDDGLLRPTVLGLELVAALR
jgi:hypothetical protein